MVKATQMWVCKYFKGIKVYAKVSLFVFFAHAPGMPGTPAHVSDPDMHHGTCVTHVLPWCMPGSLTDGFHWSRWRENVPGIPGACETCNFTSLARDPCNDPIIHLLYDCNHAFMWTKYYESAHKLPCLCCKDDTSNCVKKINMRRDYNFINISHFGLVGNIAVFL